MAPPKPAAMARSAIQRRPASTADREGHLRLSAPRRRCHDRAQAIRAASRCPLRHSVTASMSEPLRVVAGALKRRARRWLADELLLTATTEGARSRRRDDGNRRGCHAQRSGFVSMASLHRHLDGRGIDARRRRIGPRRILERIRRTSAADDPDRIHPGGAKAQRPEQPRRGDLRVDLAVVRTVTDLQLPPRRQHAVELEGAALAVLLRYVVAGHGRAESAQNRGSVMSPEGARLEHAASGVCHAEPRRSTGSRSLVSS